MKITEIKLGQLLFDSRSGGGNFKVIHVNNDESSMPYILGLYTDLKINEVRDLDLSELDFVTKRDQK